MEVEVDAIALLREALRLTKCIVEVVLAGIVSGGVYPYPAKLNQRTAVLLRFVVPYLSLTVFMPPSPSISSAGLVSL